MCGIVGYIGHNNAVEVLLDGLKRLEYRGYDSAGIAILEAGELDVSRCVGKLKNLQDIVAEGNYQANIGIGHTRWATHGSPSDENSHPHRDCTGKIAVVHNGIIENFLDLKLDLEAKGHVFKSETDSEVIAHLIEEHYEGDLKAAVEKAKDFLKGSYAAVIISQDHPELLIAIRKDNPLIIGLGENSFYLASDIPAIISHTRQVISMEDDEMAVVTPVKVEIFKEGRQVDREIGIVDWDVQAAEKGGYEHFMLKEINEQPGALQETLSGRIASDYRGVVLDELEIADEQIKSISNIAIVACGTAYHAGLVGKYIIEDLLRLPVEVDIASEFRYRNPLVNKNSLVVVVSQSGETADTLAALREAKKKGALVIAITNVVGSSIAREADAVLYTHAGPEIAVASTKAYSTQLINIYLLSLYLAQNLHLMPANIMEELLKALYQLPKQVRAILEEQTEIIKKSAASLDSWEACFYLGRSLDYAVALEGALKLKEISYIHAEAYAAGELKHGTLALIEEGIPVLVLCTQEAVYEKTLSNIREVKARGAKVIGVAFEGNEDLKHHADEVIYIPQTFDMLAPVLTVVPLQMLSYYVAVSRNCDVDQPRNLAKSVTVE